MARHPPSHRMDRILHLAATSLEGIGQFTDGMLCLRDCQAITGNDDHAICAFEDHGDLFGACALDLARVDIVTVSHCGSAKPAEEHTHQRAVHGLTHDRSENQAAGPHEAAGNHQHRVVDHEAGGRGCKPRVAVEQTDHHRHVSSTDGQGQRAAQDAADGYEQPEKYLLVWATADSQHQADHRQGEACVDQVPPWIRPGFLELLEFLQLSKRNQTAEECQSANQARERGGDTKLRPRNEAGLSGGLLTRRGGDRAGQFRTCDQCRCCATKAVEESHHLRHARHRITQRHGGSDASTDCGGTADQDQWQSALLAHGLGDLGVETGSNDRDCHPGGTDCVAANGSSGAAHQLEGHDEEHRGGQVGEVDPVLARHESFRARGVAASPQGSGRYFFLGLNICSMRAVTTKPPTTLTMASVVATKPMAVPAVEARLAVTTNAPTAVTPEMALEPLVKGVCRRCGTLVITSNPTHIASRNTVSRRIKRE